MKTWKKPEVKVFDVKMDENIAASGDGGYKTDRIYYAEEPIVREWAHYRWNGSNNIQDTGITFWIESSTGKKVVNKSYVADIAECLVV